MDRRSGTRKSVTLTDVAQEAGVAPMTVSRYLNNHPNISEKTSRKVGGAIKRLGYTPNVAARVLMGQPSNTIGLLVPTLADPFFSEVAHSVQETAREEGKLVWIAATNYDSTLEASILEQMRQHHVDGVLLIPTKRPDGEAQAAPNLCIVALDRPLGANFDAVVVDNRGGTAKLVEHFVGHGYKRIYCISLDTPEVYTISERIAGYEQAIRAAQLTVDVRHASRDRRILKEMIRSAMNSPLRPDALICTNNLTSVLTLEALLEMNIKLPEEVALGGFDDFELAPFMRPGITVVRQSATDLGQQAANLLLRQLAKPRENSGGIILTLPTTLILRESCGCNRS